ncbi:MAG TPA: hypothetical protein VGM05_22820 [Planctomycetaceae bacterium]|jgi:hypothetical protein
MRIRRRADVVLGVVLLVLGAALITSLALNGHVVAAQLPHWRGAAESGILSLYSAVGWISLFVGFLLLAPAKWFDWLEKPRNSHRC